MLFIGTCETRDLFVPHVAWPKHVAPWRTLPKTNPVDGTGCTRPKAGSRSGTPCGAALNWFEKTLTDDMMPRLSMVARSLKPAGHASARLTPRTTDLALFETEFSAASAFQPKA